MADTGTNDMDFDELHNAVNALMGQDKKTKSPKKSIMTESKQPTSKTPLISKPSEPKKLEPPEDTSIAVTVKRPLPPLTTHRGMRGKAMDVVSPRAKAPIAPPSAQTKRRAPDIAPTRPVAPEPVVPAVEKVIAAKTQQATEEAEPSDDILASITMHDTPVAPTAPAVAHQKNDWPDPLDVHGFKDNDDDLLEPDAPAHPKIKDADDEQPADMVGPFLATKVEKRPLGAYTDTMPDKPVDSDKPQDVEKSDVPTEAMTAENAEPERKPDLPKEDEETSMDDLRNMAIPHQYKEKDTDEPANTDSRPVFDTTEYHPAIGAHAAAHKRNPLTMWAVAIVLLVLIIAALGVVYYIMTGGLDFSTLFTG